MIDVFDSSALIAFLRKEFGASTIARMLEDASTEFLVHSFNLCEVYEVYYDFYRSSGEVVAEQMISDLTRLGITERSDMDGSFWREVGRLKAVHRRVSLADCCGIALANRMGGVFVTADRHELEPLLHQGVCRVEFIR